MVLLLTQSRLYSFIKGSTVVIPTDDWRRGGTLVFKVNPLFVPCKPLQILTKLIFFSSRKEVRVGAIIVTKEGLDQVKNEISLALLAS